MRLTSYDYKMLQPVAEWYFKDTDYLVLLKESESYVYRKMLVELFLQDTMNTPKMISEQQGGGIASLLGSLFKEGSEIFKEDILEDVTKVLDKLGDVLESQGQKDLLQKLSKESDRIIQNLGGEKALENDMSKFCRYLTEFHQKIEQSLPKDLKNNPDIATTLSKIKSDIDKTTALFGIFSVNSEVLKNLEKLAEKRGLVDPSELTQQKGTLAQIGDKIANFAGIDLSEGKSLEKGFKVWFAQAIGGWKKGEKQYRSALSIYNFLIGGWRQSWRKAKEELLKKEGVTEKDISFFPRLAKMLKIIIKEFRVGPIFVMTYMITLIILTIYAAVNEKGKEKLKKFLQLTVKIIKAPFNLIKRVVMWILARLGLVEERAPTAKFQPAYVQAAPQTPTV